MRTYFTYFPAADALRRQTGDNAESAASAFSGPMAGATKLCTGNKINDVKKLREMTGLGVRESKEIIDTIYEKLKAAKFADLDKAIQGVIDLAVKDGFTPQDVAARFRLIVPSEF